jgi:hypothetical protein
MKRCDRTYFSTHAITRMFERGLSKEEVMQVIGSGVAIKDYPDDHTYPSRLLLGFVNTRPVHVVVTRNDENYDCLVLTAYHPSPVLWEADFKKRKQ